MGKLRHSQPVQSKFPTDTMHSESVKDSPAYFQLSTPHKQQPLKKRGPQLRNCLHRTGLWASNWCSTDWPTVGGAVPYTGRSELYKKASRGSQGSVPDGGRLKKSCYTRIDVGQNSKVSVKVSLWWSDSWFSNKRCHCLSHFWISINFWIKPNPNFCCPPAPSKTLRWHRLMHAGVCCAWIKECRQGFRSNHRMHDCVKITENITVYIQGQWLDKGRGWEAPIYLGKLSLR